MHFDLSIATTDPPKFVFGKKKKINNKNHDFASSSRLSAHLLFIVGFILLLFFCYSNFNIKKKKNCLILSLGFMYSNFNKNVDKLFPN